MTGRRYHKCEPFFDVIQILIRLSRRDADWLIDLGRGAKDSELSALKGLSRYRLLRDL